MIGAGTWYAWIGQLVLQTAQSSLVRRIRECQKLRIAIAAAQSFEKRRQITLVAYMMTIDHDIDKTNRRHLRHNELRRLGPAVRVLDFDGL